MRRYTEETCKGEYSIQSEINSIAKNEHPKEWARLIQDKEWREKMRLKLRAMPGVLWCDYRAGECACDS